jgi:hypothetical protein
MPAGRPSEYKPAFADEIINLMAEGLSLTAAAASLGFHRQRAYEWAEKNPELADAIRLGQAKRTLKLERDLLEAPSGPVVTSRIFALKNSAPEEWRDKVETEITGKDGGPLQIVLGADDEKL